MGRLGEPLTPHTVRGRSNSKTLGYLHLSTLWSQGGPCWEAMCQGSKYRAMCQGSKYRGALGSHILCMSQMFWKYVFPWRQSCMHMVAYSNSHRPKPSCNSNTGQSSYESSCGEQQQHLLSVPNFMEVHSVGLISGECVYYTKSNQSANQPGGNLRFRKMKPMQKCSKLALILVICKGSF